MCALDPARRPRDDHRAQRIGALDMAVVIYLDALRRLVEIEQLGQLAPQLRLTAALREPPVELLARVAIGHASCRERLCQYVYISVGDRDLKNKKQASDYLKELKNLKKKH